MFICNNCRKIIYCSNGLFEQALKKEKEEHAYKLINQKFEIYGLCPECRQYG